jgi:hypothetical protein
VRRSLLTKCGWWESHAGCRRCGHRCLTPYIQNRTAPNTSCLYTDKNYPKIIQDKRSKFLLGNYNRTSILCIVRLLINVACFSCRCIIQDKFIYDSVGGSVLGCRICSQAASSTQGIEVLTRVQCSVADPYPGSGIGCLFDPWIWDPGWVESQHPDPGSGMKNPDHIF